MHLNSKELSFRAPRQGATAYEDTFYGRATGLDKTRFRFVDISDDIFDNQEQAFSTDNGATWPDKLTEVVSTKSAQGTLRRFEDAKFVDPVNGLLLNTYGEGHLETDLAGEGFSAYRLRYRISADGGRTSLVDEQMVAAGYSPEHPFEFMWSGLNAFGNAGPNSVVRTRAGHLVLVSSHSVVDADRKPYNPGGGYGWFQVAVLIGKWQPDSRIEWSSAASISLDASQSTRGIFEPTIAQLPDGRLLVVMRASNGWDGDPQCLLPTHKWYSVSDDGGHSWTAAAPWRYQGGTAFYSPSSISQLMWHSNGKLYWFGNIAEKNCCGNDPRDPLLVGEVDPDSLMLKQDTLFTIESHKPGEPNVQLSNFYAHEDRVSGEIVLHMSLYHEQAPGVWGGDSYTYRIQP